MIHTAVLTASGSTIRSRDSKARLRADEHLHLLPDCKKQAATV